MNRMKADPASRAPVRIACALGIALGASVLAEQTAIGADSGTLEEVIVTARHREERLQDVPDTVRAISSEEIENAGIGSVNEAFDLVSNAVIFADQQPGVQTVTLRGISQARGADSESAFAFVVDGVTSPTIFSLTQDLYDIERIEVLKGPQGALYGRNAIGGAINVITRQPTNEFEVGTKLTYGEGNERRISARASGPIVKEKALFRLAGSYSDFDGQLTNVTLGDEVDFEEEYSVRGQLELTLTESLDISIRASYVDTDGGAVYNVAETAGTFGATPGLIQEDERGLGGRQLLDLSTRISWDTSFGTLLSITAYTDLDTDLHQDLDFTQLSVAEANQFVILDSWMQELRFSSPDTARLRWSFGGFIQQTDRDIRTQVFINRNGPLGAVPGGPGGPGTPSNKNMAKTADRIPKWTYESTAFFGMAEYDFTDRLSLTAGFRWDHEQRDFSQAGAEVNSGNKTFEEFQPKASLSFKPSETSMIYLTYATGFRPGGFNPFIGYSPDGTYDKETTTNYELGWKSTWLERRLTFNAAAFYIDSEDTHQRLLNVLRGQAEYFNVGDTSYRGFEVEVFARPIEALSLTASYGITDSEVESINPRITNIGGLNPLTFIGNRVPRVNYDTLSLAGQYEARLAEQLALLLRADYRRVGTGYWYLDNADVEEPYEVLDLRASLRGKQWALTAFVDNVLEEDWRVTFNNTRFEGLLGGINIHWPSPERQFGVEFSYEFF
jgi:iron complex outermembrane receptor protein